MIPFKQVIYDLDGTLLDAFEDIRTALNFALERCGLPVHSLEAVKSFVGEGIGTLVRRALGTDHQQRFDEVLPLVANYYRDNPTGTAQPYPGVKEALLQIRELRLNQVILTNKPHAIAVEACRNVGLAQLVDRVQGEAAGFPLKPNPEAALAIAREFGVEPKECVVVGDGKPDVDLARAAGMKVIGCTWGMHTSAQIEALNPDAIIDQMEDLVEALAFLNS